MGESISSRTGDSVISLALDTISKKKQALVFVNTKRSAEKAAEDISNKIKRPDAGLSALSDKILKSLSRPTRQCERLARCVKRGIAFHHAGLHSAQKRLIEDAFRNGVIKIICCTPTLAMGIDLPAFRTIIRDVRRYGSQGLDEIPVLEYLQMAGRAGRPRFDTFGESIAIARTDTDKDFLVERYLLGEPEEITSKLAVEPVLRTYLLSLIASKIINSEDEIIDFFSRTFWAFQYHNISRLNQTIDKILNQLIAWGFLVQVQDVFRATTLGKRIAELYIDPLTAYGFLQGLERAKNIALKHISFLQLVSNTLEMRPLLRVKTREFDEVQEEVASSQPYLLQLEPNMFEHEYEDWLSSFKTALMFKDWTDEKDEEYLLEHYDIRPGETRGKLEIADWLLYALSELARIQKLPVLKDIKKTRFCLKYGVKEELLPLVRLKNIGRVRARKLFKVGIKNLEDIRNASFLKLSQLLGPAVAKSIKEQLGQGISFKR